MGSFAASLHVKTTDADQVTTALNEILLADAWQPITSAAPAEHRRGIQVSAAAGGWVSVLDSDLAGSHAALPRLAARLACPAIFCYVNDSDSFGYLVADPQGNTSEFDSEDFHDDEHGEDAEVSLVNAAAAIGNLNGLLENSAFLQKMQEFQARLSSAAPADIREAEERLKTGRGSAADVQTYQAWAMQEMPRHLDQMKAMLGAVTRPGAATSVPATTRKPPRSQSRAERAAWKKLLAALRPLLAPGVSDEDVQHVCRRQAVFAEEVLADFLRLLGITDFYAHLSYNYLDEAGPEELAAYRIRFVHHLQFERRQP